MSRDSCLPVSAKSRSRDAVQQGDAYSPRAAVFYSVHSGDS